MNFLSNINMSDIKDKESFWKTVTPFFADKIKTKSKIALIKKKTVVSQEGQEKIGSEKIISEDQAAVEVLTNFSSILLLT